MSKKPETEVAVEAPIRTVRVEFLKGYRPVHVPADNPACSDPCWKYEPGESVDLPYDEAKRAVELGIATRAFEDAL